VSPAGNRVVGMPTETSGPRGRLAGPLAGLAVLLALLALVLSYAGRAVLQAEPFADRAVAVLTTPAVQDDIADHITDVVVRQVAGGDLVTARPAVRAITGAIVGSGAFAGLFHRAALELHASLVSGHGGPILLTIADAGVLIQGALERLAPDAARQVGADRVATLGSLRPGGAVFTVVRVARNLYAIAWALGVASIVLALLAFWRSRDRRSTAQQLGIELALGGLIIASLYAIGGDIAARLATPGRAGVVTAVWKAFGHGLFVQALIAAGAGAIVAAVAAAAERAPGSSSADERLTARARVGRALLTIAAGVVIVLEPGAAVTVAVSAAGLFLVYIGVRGVSGVAAASREASQAGGRRARRIVSRLAAPAVAIGAVAAAAAIVATGGGDEAAAVTPTTCNGYAALCDRPLNDVAFAATHNSMASVTIPSWLFGQQDGTIQQQLDDGIRGLLIDTYYGFPVKGGVRTDLSSLPKRQIAAQEIGEPAVKAAERIRSRIGDQNLGRRQIYLCHAFCEIGAVTLDSALADLRTYLVSNPGAVVIVINQDEGVTPADIERAFEQAGLLELVYRGPFGPFPTLREMIDSGQRLVVMAENEADDISWYPLAYRNLLQETPFTFKSTAALTDPTKLAASCRANRGTASAPLFLVNNWVDTTPAPRASAAAAVNAHSALLQRAQTCQRIRHRLPNLVAVDFYKRGDVFGVVRALNGL
jgi:hypothetical protein